MLGARLNRISLIRSIAAATALCFGAHEAAAAAPALTASNVPVAAAAVLPLSQLIRQPAQIDIPFNVATLQEVHAGTSGKLIIHIQDAHANLSGQQSLAKAVEHFVSAYGIRVVLVEGADRDVSLDEVRKLAPLNEWKVIARRFLYEGIVSGEEYLNLTTEHPMRLRGIEYQDLYDEAVKTYAALVDRRKDVLHYLHKSKVSLDRLKAKMYPAELRRYEERKGADTLGDGAGFADTLKALFALLPGSGLDLAGFPALAKLKETMDREAALDFERANQEQARILGRLGPEEAKTFAEASRRLRHSQVSQYRLTRQLLDQASGRGMDVGNFPELAAYADYLERFLDLKMEQVLVEQEKLEDDLFDRLLPDDDARKLRAIDRFLGLIGNAYKLQMSSHEFAMYEFNEKDFPTESWLGFMNRKLADLGFFESMVPAEDHLEEAYGDFKKFYRLVSDRDGAFVENAARIMNEEKAEAAILIAGGYHTDHLTRLLRDAGDSYIVLTPLVTDTTDHEKYEQILLGHLKDQERRLAAARHKQAGLGRAENVAATKIPRGIRAMPAAARFAEMSSASGARMAAVEKFVEGRKPGLLEGIRNIARAIMRRPGTDRAVQQSPNVIPLALPGIPIPSRPSVTSGVGPAVVISPWLEAHHGENIRSLLEQGLIDEKVLAHLVELTGPGRGANMRQALVALAVLKHVGDTATEAVKSGFRDFLSTLSPAEYVRGFFYHNYNGENAEFLSLFMPLILTKEHFEQPEVSYETMERIYAILKRDNVPMGDPGRLKDLLGSIRAFGNRTDKLRVEYDPDTGAYKVVQIDTEAVLRTALDQAHGILVRLVGDQAPDFEDRKADYGGLLSESRLRAYLGRALIFDESEVIRLAERYVRIMVRYHDLLESSGLPSLDVIKSIMDRYSPRGIDYMEQILTTVEWLEGAGFGKHASEYLKTVLEMDGVKNLGADTIHTTFFFQPELLPQSYLKDAVERRLRDLKVDPESDFSSIMLQIVLAEQLNRVKRAHSDLLDVGEKTDRVGRIGPIDETGAEDDTSSLLARLIQDGFGSSADLPGYRVVGIEPVRAGAEELYIAVAEDAAGGRAEFYVKAARTSQVQSELAAHVVGRRLGRVVPRAWSIDADRWSLIIVEGISRTVPDLTSDATADQYYREMGRLLFFEWLVADGDAHVHNHVAMMLNGQLRLVRIDLTRAFSGYGFNSIRYPENLKNFRERLEVIDRVGAERAGSAAQLIAAGFDEASEQASQASGSLRMALSDGTLLRELEDIRGPDAGKWIELLEMSLREPARFDSVLEKSGFDEKFRRSFSGSGARMATQNDLPSVGGQTLGAADAIVEYVTGTDISDLPFAPASVSLIKSVSGPQGPIIPAAYSPDQLIMLAERITTDPLRNQTERFFRELPAALTAQKLPLDHLAILMGLYVAAEINDEGGRIFEALSQELWSSAVDRAVSEFVDPQASWAPTIRSGLLRAFSDTEDWRASNPPDGLGEEGLAAYLRSSEELGRIQRQVSGLMILMNYRTSRRVAGWRKRVEVFEMEMGAMADLEGLSTLSLRDILASFESDLPADDDEPGWVGHLTAQLDAARRYFAIFHGLDIHAILDDGSSMETRNDRLGNQIRPIFRSKYALERMLGSLDAVDVFLRQRMSRLSVLANPHFRRMTFVAEGRAHYYHDGRGIYLPLNERQQDALTHEYGHAAHGGWDKSLGVFVDSAEAVQAIQAASDSFERMAEAASSERMARSMRDLSAELKRLAISDDLSGSQALRGALTAVFTQAVRLWEQSGANEVVFEAEFREMTGIDWGVLNRQPERTAKYVVVKPAEDLPSGEEAVREQDHELIAVGMNAFYRNRITGPLRSLFALLVGRGHGSAEEVLLERLSGPIESAGESLNLAVLNRFSTMDKESLVRIMDELPAGLDDILMALKVSKADTSGLRLLTFMKYYPDLYIGLMTASHPRLSQALSDYRLNALTPSSRLYEFSEILFGIGIASRRLGWSPDRTVQYLIEQADLGGTLKGWALSMENAGARMASTTDRLTGVRKLEGTDIWDHIGADVRSDPRVLTTSYDLTRRTASIVLKSVIGEREMESVQINGGTWDELMHFYEQFPSARFTVVNVDEAALRRIDSEIRAKSAQGLAVPDVELHLADASILDRLAGGFFPDASRDLVIAIGLDESVFPVEVGGSTVERALSGIVQNEVRMLRPGGYLLHVTPSEIERKKYFFSYHMEGLLTGVETHKGLYKKPSLSIAVDGVGRELFPVRSGENWSSNPNFIYADSAGREYFVKVVNEPAQAVAERIGYGLFKLLGLPVQEFYEVAPYENGKWAVVSPFEPGFVSANVESPDYGLVETQEAFGLAYYAHAFLNTSDGPLLRNVGVRRVDGLRRIFFTDFDRSLGLYTTDDDKLDRSDYLPSLDYNLTNPATKEKMRTNRAYLSESADPKMRQAFIDRMRAIQPQLKALVEETERRVRPAFAEAREGRIGFGEGKIWEGMEKAFRAMDSGARMATAVDVRAREPLSADDLRTGSDPAVPDATHDAVENWILEDLAAMGLTPSDLEAAEAVLKSVRSIYERADLLTSEVYHNHLHNLLVTHVFLAQRIGSGREGEGDWEREAVVRMLLAAIFHDLRLEKNPHRKVFVNAQGQPDWKSLNAEGIPVWEAASVASTDDLLAKLTQGETVIEDELFGELRAAAHRLITGSDDIAQDGIDQARVGREMLAVRAMIRRTDFPSDVDPVRSFGDGVKIEAALSTAARSIVNRYVAGELARDGAERAMERLIESGLERINAADELGEDGREAARKRLYRVHGIESDYLKALFALVSDDPSELKNLHDLAEGLENADQTSYYAALSPEAVGVVIGSLPREGVTASPEGSFPFFFVPALLQPRMLERARNLPLEMRENLMKVLDAYWRLTSDTPGLAVPFASMLNDWTDPGPAVAGENDPGFKKSALWVRHKLGLKDPRGNEIKLKGPTARPAAPQSRKSAPAISRPHPLLRPGITLVQGVVRLVRIADDRYAVMASGVGASGTEVFTNMRTFADDYSGRSTELSGHIGDVAYATSDSPLNSRVNLVRPATMEETLAVNAGRRGGHDAAGLRKLADAIRGIRDDRTVVIGLDADLHGRLGPKALERFSKKVAGFGESGKVHVHFVPYREGEEARVGEGYPGAQVLLFAASAALQSSDPGRFLGKGLVGYQVDEGAYPDMARAIPFAVQLALTKHAVDLQDGSGTRALLGRRPSREALEAMKKLEESAQMVLIVDHAIPAELQGVELEAVFMSMVEASWSA